MKVGDIVKTRVPGFGTGKNSKMGTIIDTREFVKHREAGVRSCSCMEDGTFLEWYPWQLVMVQEIS